MASEPEVHSTKGLGSGRPSARVVPRFANIPLGQRQWATWGSNPQPAD